MNQADYLSLCHDYLLKAFIDLGFSLTEEEIDSISHLIVEGMTGKWRMFHNFNHLLMVSNTGDPLITLAGLFHDLIYLQIDEHIPFNFTPYLTPFIIKKGNIFCIKSSLNYQDTCFSIVRQIFNLELGDSLSSPKGQNEFLSALTAAKILESYLPLPLITRIVTMIELTIPFRHSTSKNKTIPQELQEKLEKVNQDFNIGLTPSEITTTICQAVILANIDISGFASANVIDFINNTWLLLPETNHALRDTYKYTIQDYRLSLANTTKFINFLKPNLIFHRYHNEPNIDTFQELINICERNLIIGRLYLEIKLVSLAILEAISTRFFPYLPLAFFWGISPYSEIKYPSIFDFLPSFSPLKSDNSLENTIIQLLSLECNSYLFPDINLSRFSSLILHYLSFDSIIQYQSPCYLFFDSQLSREEFLAFFPPNLISMITDSMVKLFSHRHIKVQLSE